MSFQKTWPARVNVKVGLLEIAMDADASVIALEIEKFVREVRSARNFELPDELPAAVIILACLKHCTHSLQSFGECPFLIVGVRMPSNALQQCDNEVRGFLGQKLAASVPRRF